MKKFVLAAVAASMVLTPAMASAQSRTVIKERPGRTVVVERDAGRYGTQVRRTVVRQPRFDQRVGYRDQQFRNWQRGQRFDARYARNYRQIDYRQYRGRGLYQAPRGYQWVQSGSDAVLVALASGLIGAVIGGALN